MQAVQHRAGAHLSRDFVTWHIHVTEFVLYRTAKGALFLHDHSTYKYVKGGKPVTEDTAREMTAEQALEWIAGRRAVILDATGLPLPPEA
jgi:hypothetical protein